LIKLREYVALLYTTSNCLCDKSDEVITAMYFEWRPVNYSLAKSEDSQNVHEVSLIKLKLQQF